MDHDSSGIGAGNPLMPTHSSHINPVTPGLQPSSHSMPTAHPAVPETAEATAFPGAPAAPAQPSQPSQQAHVSLQAAMAQIPPSAESVSGYVGGSFSNTIPDEPSRPAQTQPGMPYSALTPIASSGFSQSDQPMPVVKVLSVRGLEYLMMSLSLWIADAALLWVVLALFNGEIGFSILAFPLATLLVTGPIFAYLFLRLKKAELLDPSLRYDPSKRRTTQFTQLFTFLVCIANVIGFLYVVINKIGGGTGMSIGRAFLNMLAILVVIGGVFAYYWIDEHRTKS